MKNTQSEIKAMKIGKRLEQRIALGAKIIHRILGQKK